MSNRRLIQITLFICLAASISTANGQTSGEIQDGNVSYISTSNIYVRFAETGNISAGDTLYRNENGSLVPALLVVNASSVSCLCTAIAGKTFQVGDRITRKVKPIATGNQANSAEKVQTAATGSSPDTTKKSVTDKAKRQATVGGSVSLASYLNFSSSTSNYERMRYTLSLHTGNNKSKLTSEVYLTFAHKPGEWDVIQEDIFNGLKIYNLSVSYKFNNHHQIWFGRKINPRLSSAGALDGLQYEFRINAFTMGIVGGTRPDYKNYSFNSTLPQAGGYISHDLNGANGNMQTTLAFMQQMNSGKTDRRFMYFQHVNALVKNLYFFGSAELDLYNQTFVPEDSTLKQDNSPRLSNLYLSLRYRPVKALSVSVSYSERQNIIYYETYKDIIQTLLEAATVKGWVVQANVFPVKNLSIGLQGSYREGKNDFKPTKSFYGYLTFAKIPGIKASGTVSATFLETGYLSSGAIYSAGLSKDLIRGKLNSGIGYKYVDYEYVSGETGNKQHIPEISLSWRIVKKLSFSVYYEGTFEKLSNFNRIYFNITQRF
jgi:hypothetical protein